MSSKKQLAADAYTVGLVYVKTIEMNAITAMVDEFHQSISMRHGDDNEYTLGRIGKHNVAIAGPAKGAQGKVAIVDVVSRMPLAFKNIRVCLLVGIGGGVPHPPKKDVRLGDVVIGAPESGPAVVQYDLGKQTTHDIEVVRTLNKPSGLLLRVVDKVDNEYQRAEEGEDGFFATHLRRFARFPRMRELYKRPCTPDRLFQASYGHVDGTLCSSHDHCYEVSRPNRNPDDIQIHYSTILSGDLVMKSAKIRDQLSCKFHDALCFEMEAAGLMDVFPCLIIRGICDYSDSHKNKDWQEYAAATAAAYAREILLSMAERVVEELSHSATDQLKAPEKAQSATVNFSGDHNSGFQLGQNTDRPETPPSPSSTVPFLRDRDFVYRGTLLDQMDQKCSVPASRTALVGLGGAGKSQLAIEYSYLIRDRSPETWIFWVHASNAARFEQSYREIADHMKILERRRPKADIFKLVHDWLCNAKCKWVLIFDNVDDARFLVEASTTGQEGQTSGLGSRSSLPLWTNVPRSQNGSVLITTRTRSAASKLVEESDMIAVEPMDEGPAVALLNKKLRIECDQKDIAELATALEYMPLAIVQAAAYISQRAPRCTVRQYTEKFRKSDQGKTSLLDYEAGHLRRDWEAKSSIIITWQISFDHISETWRSAANLLSLMSFFDRQGIPEALVRSQSEYKSKRGSGRESERRSETREAKGKCGEESDDEDAASNWSCDEQFENDVLILRNYSFIFVNMNKTTFEMHGLVQLATRKWLEAHGQFGRWNQQYITNLSSEFPTGEYENWGKCQALFPHARTALARQPDGESSLREWALILYRAGWYAWARGNQLDAEKMSVKTMKTRKIIFGEEHKDTLSSIAMVALVYKLRGRWKEAEELEVQVMETRKRVLGQEHPSTLTSMANLASTYQNQGRWKEAEELEVQVMETRKRVLGQEHPSTLTSMANLASTFRNQGRWKEAEELEVQVMETRKRVLGQEHPSTLASMANLASTYRNQGRWKEAEELFVQVMETSLRVLGQEHPDTLTSMANLASTFWNQGRWKEAEELDVQVMETRKRVLGQEHPDTLTSMANLASTFRNQGRWKEAEELFVQVMETSLRVLGQEHPSTLTSMANLASTFWNQGRWKKAEELEVQVMETSLRVLGQEHPDTLTSMANLASTFRNQGRLKKAAELDVQVMETRKRVLGQEHPDTLTSMNSLAFTWKSQGRQKEALALMEDCYQLQSRTLGSNHPFTLSSLASLDEWKVEE